jgi:hypothetical protein
MGEERCNCRHEEHGQKYAYATRECISCKRNPMMPDNWQSKPDKDGG